MLRKNIEGCEAGEFHSIPRQLGGVVYYEIQILNILSISPNGSASFVCHKKMHKSTFYLNIAIIVFIMQICAGCGSLQTLLPNSKYNLKYNKRYEKTNCNSIPRVYSGLSLDVCMAFLGPPALMYGNHNKSVFYGYMLDMLLSSAVDTLALPYTIIRQIKDGSLHLKRGAIINMNKY